MINTFLCFFFWYLLNFSFCSQTPLNTSTITFCMLACWILILCSTQYFEMVPLSLVLSLSLYFPFSALLHSLCVLCDRRESLSVWWKRGCEVESRVGLMIEKENEGAKYEREQSSNNNSIKCYFVGKIVASGGCAQV